MRTDEQNGPCQCGAEPGEPHREWDDVARCKSTGRQLITCEGELHEYNGREYGEHDGECGPDIWDGEWPGTKQCRKYGLYINRPEFGGWTEDLNALYAYGRWDRELQQLVIDPATLVRLQSESVIE